MRCRIEVVAVAVACVVSFGAAAHHSLAIYSSDAVEVEGEITCRLVQCRAGETP